MLSDSEIENAKKETKYSHGQPHHEHNDCIRMACEWLDAQKKTKGHIRKSYDIKHLIEKWAGRYVSQSDVEVAASLHADIKGKYPYFNISSRLTEPSKNRLNNISEAFKHDYQKRHDPSTYTYHED